ncbi:RNA polymerase sigma factor [Pseudarthrobacter phenanthrenivorans]|uniref:RNA polymerase sigma factor n=1 Tax=Micrococcaceae TaxID=1268 RepID=UPI001112596D|nr:MULTISPECIES: RNA polymerase sigma factor [Micrococcaceae]TNB73608.1 RNA polymerase sigma factor [Arthrobacter sp. BB-1]TPV49429.1 RNA polymerase sigma factor [Pseudarthrobacter phenanthrenivorans]
MGNFNHDEHQLWKSSVSGDGAAFTSLFDRHRDRVFRHAYRLAGHRQNAEDITATAFLELWRLRHRVRLVDGSVLPWLLVATTNLTRNSNRAIRRHQRLIQSLPRMSDAPDASEEFLVYSPQDTLDKELADALCSLNRQDQLLISLVVFEEYPIATAAEVLEITPSAAKSRMHRARQRMKLAIAHTQVPALEGKTQ